MGPCDPSNCQAPQVGAVASAFDPGIPGFDYTDVTVGPTRYRHGIAGTGPAVLLLHWFSPDALVLASRRARARRERHRRRLQAQGHGESRSAPGGPQGEGYSNRERAAEFVESWHGWGSTAWAANASSIGVSARLAS
jgi:hypothetical protein